MELAMKPEKIPMGLQMVPTKVEGFFREFPWVRAHLDDAVTQVYVSRMDTRTLLMQRRRYFNERITLLDEEGLLILGEVATRSSRREFFLFGETITVVKRRGITGILDPGETVGGKLEALQELAHKVRYVLYEVHERRTDGNADALILYKAPKGVASVVDWIEQQTEKMSSAYRQFAEAIDAEAV